ncbi:uncharacterized protein EI90DRAFT_3017775 [Cantharellus anzutake]|uniref:uncharacterized protein n=1 Tax=Cantharellus anzutake TaxID=1750568 RepID=UPI0019045B04|nr:uncharacterized protein EI90DRAFT_3017775 [Cantharellus anzutake]KAF8328093.1 hypothetical protein EI90DRAFT_3017775 [Cantharellus anzutake]
MSFQPGIPYVLINTKSNTALDDRKWTFESIGAGLYNVKNGTGEYLGLEGLIEIGKRLSATDTPRFYWSIEKDPSFENIYRIFVGKTKLSLELANNGSSANETPAILWYNALRQGFRLCVAQHTAYWEGTVVAGGGIWNTKIWSWTGFLEKSA